MAKTITMPESEYSEDLQKAIGKGINMGRAQLIGAVDSILTGKAEKVVLNENLEQDVIDFVNRVRIHVGLDVAEIAPSKEAAAAQATVVTDESTDV